MAVVEPAARGGMIHYAHQLCRGLAEAGAEPTLVTARADELAALPHPYRRLELLRLWDDQWIKERESRAGSVFAADGTLYALRRELYVPIADPAQADDIALSARVVLQGRRLLFEPRAVAWEEAPAEGRAELARKVRVTNHSVRALWNLGGALWTSGFYSLELLSHKLFRHLVPFFLLPMLASHLVLAAAPGPVGQAARWLLLPHLGFYALAVAGFLLRRLPVGRWRALSVPYYFTLVNTAALLGVLSILAGRRLRAWTPRSGLENPKGTPP